MIASAVSANARRTAATPATCSSRRSVRLRADVAALYAASPTQPLGWHAAANSSARPISWSYRRFSSPTAVFSGSAFHLRTSPKVAIRTAAFRRR
nr:hypothetical protein [Kibdelosporangium sp. MJ126-NF4]